MSNDHGDAIVILLFALFVSQCVTCQRIDNVTNAIRDNSRKCETAAGTKQP